MTNDHSTHHWLTVSLRTLLYLLAFATIYLLLQGFFSFTT